jgi:hypothetical protein
MIKSVMLEAADEEYGPPAKIVQISQVEDDIFITVYKYDETFDTESLTNGYNVPVLRKDDLIRALVALDNNNTVYLLR